MAFNLDILDQEIDTSGAEWVDTVPDHPGVSFKVRSNNYKPFATANAALLRSIGAKTQEEAYATEKYQIGMGKLLAKHILTDWKNAVTVSGEYAPYSAELAEKILTSVDEVGMGAVFRLAVIRSANIVSERRLGFIEDAAGN